MFLLDTTVVSELRKATSGRAHPNVTRWATTVLADQMFLSAITVLELEAGVLLIERRDPTRGTVLRTWLDRVLLPEFTQRILSVDAEVARQCARLHVPDPRPERDALLAATALVHGMTVVTRDVTDFQPTGVALLNPWS